MPRPHSKGVNQNLPASVSTLLGARVRVRYRARQIRPLPLPGQAVPSSPPGKDTRPPAGRRARSRTLGLQRSLRKDENPAGANVSSSYPLSGGRANDGHVDYLL